MLMIGYLVLFYFIFCY